MSVFLGESTVTEKRPSLRRPQGIQCSTKQPVHQQLRGKRIAVIKSLFSLDDGGTRL